MSFFHSNGGDGEALLGHAKTALRAVRAAPIFNRDSDPFAAKQVTFFH